MISKHLVSGGWKVLLVSRSLVRLRATEQRLRSIAPQASIRSIRADLSILREVRGVAQEIESSDPRIDALVNNAGAIFARREETPEGHERTFALNVLAPFLLTQLLLDRLRSSAPSRVINVSSAAHRFGRLRLEDLERKRHSSAWARYDQSKLALLMLTYEFARRSSDRSVTFNACHPGFVATRFGHNNVGLLKSFLVFTQRMVGVAPERGAETPTYLVTATEIAGVSGAYFVNRRDTRSSRASYRQPDGERLWEYCENLVRGT